jgi:hypothetical protein
LAESFTRLALPGATHECVAVRLAPAGARPLSASDLDRQVADVVVPDGAKGLGDFLEQYLPPGWLYWPLLIAASVGAFVLGVLASDADFGNHGWLRVAGSACVVLTVALPSWKAWAADRQRKRATTTLADNRERFNVTLGRYVAPISESLAQYTRIKKGGAAKNRLRGELRTMILTALLELSGCRDARVALYLYGAPSSSGARDLVYQKHLGRDDRPRKRFVKGSDARADAVHRLVEEGSVELDTNVLDPQSPDVALYAGKGYATYLAASIFAGDEALGMLAIDAPVAGSLDSTHKGVIKALAPLMAAALAS